MRSILTWGGGFLCLSASVLLAQAPIPDRVEVRDKKDGSTKFLNGKLILNKNGLQLVTTDKKATLLNFEDILRIEPGDLPDVDRISFKAAYNSEDKKTSKDYESARSIYSDLLKKVKDPAAKRHLEYRLALISTRLADLEADGPKWKELVEVALKEWESFLLNHTSGWEIWLAARTASRLHVELGSYDKAARLWSSLSKLTDLPADLQLEAVLQQVDALFRSKNYAAAASVVSTALKQAKPGNARDRLELYDLAIQEARQGLSPATIDKLAKQIEQRLDKLTDSTVRATAFSILGELYLQDPQRLREAMWAYLWVETVYNTDKYEVHKAAIRLVEIFQALKDEERLLSERERLRLLRDSL
jgi:tetratricopeptide (TPR) repeat protein